MYEPEELVIKFFEVTEKPARLYYPEKKVLIGNKISEQVTVYSTFKWLKVLNFKESKIEFDLRNFSIFYFYLILFCSLSELDITN